VKVIAQCGHVVAAAIWIGGLAALLVALRWIPSGERGRVVRRFSKQAGPALAVLAVTGMARSLNELPSPGALLDSGYGRLVSVKIALLVVLGTLGAYNHYRSVGRVDRGTALLRRVSTGELAVAVIAFVAAAALASTSPPAPAGAAVPPGVHLAGSDNATFVKAEVDIVPGLAGPNTFTVEIVDYDSGEGIDLAEARLALRHLDDRRVGESVIQLERTDRRGMYRASSRELSLDGRWELAVRGQGPTMQVEVRLPMATRCRTDISDSPGQPAIYTARIAGVGQMQGYVDAGRTGVDELHLTFLDEAGTEMPLGGAPIIRLTRPGAPEDGESLPSRKLSPGHFVSDVLRLEDGGWRVDVVAAGPKGSLRACLEQRADRG
jgi:hypothetical protein